MGASPNIILQKESYLAMIHNAVGSSLFRNLYLLVDGEKRDILNEGSLSCAFFVSSILHQFQLTAMPHATVSGLERDLKESGWTLAETPRVGDVLIWEPKLQGSGTNAHVGFYLGDDRAISNDWQTRMPAEHHLTYGTNPDGTPIRAVVAVYTHVW